MVFFWISTLHNNDLVDKGTLDPEKLSIEGKSLSIQDAIKTLSDREREILTMRYYIGKTQIEVSDEIGISQAQVSRLEKNALKTIKSFLV